jgi:hypothetical protein
MMQQMCGISSNVTQAGHVIGFYNKTVGEYTPIVITAAQLIGTLISILLIRKFELKNITLFGGYSLTLCNGLLGILFYYLHWEYSMICSSIVIVLYMFVFGLTLGSSVWPYITYIVPQNFIQVGLIINWLAAAFCITAFEVVTAYVHSPYPVYFFYMGFIFICTLINSYFLIPIKGLSFRKIMIKMNEK